MTPRARILYSLSNNNKDSVKVCQIENHKYSIMCCVKIQFSEIKVTTLNYLN